MNEIMNNKLEIIIPTWNRSEYLEKTLSQFAKSPFINYKITIIDNASTDNTQEVCNKYKEIFPKFEIRRNNKNIGLAANILRCYEIATAEYLWLLGDNDEYDFTYCEDVIEAIESSEFDLIFIQNTQNVSLKKSTVHEIINNGKMGIVGAMGTISNYILRTDLYTSECIQEGYVIAKYLYPQLAFAKKAYADNFSIFFSENELRIGKPNPHVEYNTLELINGWVASNLILEKKICRFNIKTFLNHKLIIAIIGGILSAKARKINNYRRTLNDLMISLIRGKGIVIGLCYSILMLIVSLTPHKIAKFILNKHNKKNNIPLIE